MGTSDLIIDYEKDISKNYVSNRPSAAHKQEASNHVDATLVLTPKGPTDASKQIKSSQRLKQTASPKNLTDRDVQNDCPSESDAYASSQT